MMNINKADSFQSMRDALPDPTKNSSATETRITKHTGTHQQETTVANMSHPNIVNSSLQTDQNDS